MVSKLLFSRSNMVVPFLRVIACATSGCIASSSAAVADYRYISDDPIITHERLISDLGSGQLDRQNLSPEFLVALQQGGPFTPTRSRLAGLGPLRQVCMLFGLKSKMQRTISLRTIHDQGCGEWLITISEQPEIIRGISFKDKIGDNKKCGAPTFLPMPPAPGSADSFYIPPQLTCHDAQ